MARRKPTSKPAERLFAENQKDLFEKSYEEQLKEDKNRPVECLGMTFPDDNARREYFLGILREKLKDPDFRKIDGFPIGEDEDILALSDPPYYTACPNPWVSDFIAHWRTEQRGLRTEGNDNDTQHSVLSTQSYQREPFAADVSEGKNDPIYNATPITPRSRTRPSCGTSSITPNPGMWSLTDSAGPGWQEWPLGYVGANRPWRLWVIRSAPMGRFWIPRIIAYRMSEDAGLSCRICLQWPPL